MNDSDESNKNDAKSLFAKAMTGVQPLKHSSHYTAAIAADRPRKNRVNVVGSTTEAEAGTVSDYSSTEVIREWRKSGVQDKRLRALRSGKAAIEGRLDLHGYKRDQALKALPLFVRQLQQQGAQYGLIIHGKGLSSNDQKAVLQPLVLQWLQHQGAVLAYCRAAPQFGGEGATAILLKRQSAEDD